MIEVLRLLEQDGSLTAGQMAAMLGRQEQDVQAMIDECREKKILLGYSALIDWDKVATDFVTALIEVNISPQRGEGFDRIAERIYQYEEVESLYLMSGAFDLAVTIRAESLNAVAQFVFARLATIDGVTGTSTHFILKKYKEKHTVFSGLTEQEERVLFV